MRKIKPRWDEDSIVQANTDIDRVMPSDPVWNYVSLSNHPECKEVEDNDGGKWLLFVPDEIFVQTFRELAKMAANFELTYSFKASGEEGSKHVFCIYCQDYRNIRFIRKVAETLLNRGFVERFGYQYRDGTKAIFFKSNETTHYKSNALGEHLTLFRYNDKKELHVKEFNDDDQFSWRLVVDEDPTVVDNFENHQLVLTFKEDDDLDG